MNRRDSFKCVFGSMFGLLTSPTEWVTPIVNYKHRYTYIENRLFSRISYEIQEEIDREMVSRMMDIVNKNKK